MDTSKNTDKAAREIILGAYERFYRLARPTWTERLEAADAALEKSRNRRPDGRRRQFSVGIADRAQLDALAEALELPHSKVINLALDELAERVGLLDDFYRELFADSCQRAALYLAEEYGLEGEEAIYLAARFGRECLPKRREWVRILMDEAPPLPSSGHANVRFTAEDGSDADPDGKKALLWNRFEDYLLALFSGRFRYRIERWREQRP